MCIRDSFNSIRGEYVEMLKGQIAKSNNGIEDVSKRQGQSESVSVCGTFWGLTQTLTPMKH